MRNSTKVKKNKPKPVNFTDLYPAKTSGEPVNIITFEQAKAIVELHGYIVCEKNVQIKST